MDIFFLVVDLRLASPVLLLLCFSSAFACEGAVESLNFLSNKE